jgi:RNA polymerase sigma-70 factor (ECF subfamily)
MKGSLPDLDRLRQQDHVAFKSLVVRYHTRLVLVAKAIVGAAWAEEVVQDSWLAAYNALPDFQGRSAISTWLITIVKNTAMTRLRKESRLVSMDTGFPADVDDEGFLEADRFTPAGKWANQFGDWGTDSAAGLMEQQELQHLIDAAISRMPVQQKAVLMMRDVQQMGVVDVCNILDISHSNARVLLHRARLKLFETINTYLESGEC